MKLKKFISIITTACFLVTFTGQNLSWANTPKQQHSIIDEFKKIFDGIPKIPAEYGKVTHINDLGSKSIVVNIQDLHCHPEAQRAIAKIIEILDMNYKVKNIFVEGAYDKVDISWLSNISEKEIRESIIDNLLEEGRLNASEYYAVKNNKKEMLLGLENEDKHKENVKRLGYILERQEVYKSVLSEIKNNLDYLDIQYTNDRNKRFNRTLDRYKEKRISEEKFYVLVQKYINKINAAPEKYNNVLPINLSEYPNIQNYILFMKLSSKIKMKRVYSQLQSLLALLKEKLPPEGFQLFLDKTENLTNIDMLSISLTNFCETFDLNLDINYSHLNMFFKNQALSRSVNPLDMIQEERHLIERLRASFSYDQTEYEISFLNDFYGYFSDYLQNSLMPDDFAYFVSRFDQFRELYAKYSVVNSIDLISEDFDLLHTYYNLNNRRNDIFIENIYKYSTPNSSLDKNTQKRKADDCFNDAEEIIIVVTGGYHTPGLQELLSAKGITNIIVTPTVSTEIENAEKIYEGIVLQQSIFLREALAFTVASQATTQEQYNLITTAAFSYLNKAMSSRSFDFDRAVKILEGIYKDSMGAESISNIRKEGDDYVIDFGADSSISSITIQNEDGKLSLKQSTVDEKTLDENSNLKPAGFNEKTAEKLFKFAGKFAVSSVQIPATDSYEFIKGLFLLAENRKELRNFTFSHGLTIDLDTYANEHNLTEIDGVSLNIVARMPAQMQEAMMQKDKEAKALVEKEKEISSVPEDTTKPQNVIFVNFKKALIQAAAAVILVVFTTIKAPGVSALPPAQEIPVPITRSLGTEVHEIIIPTFPFTSKQISDTGAVDFFAGRSKDFLPEAQARPIVNSESNIAESIKESEKKDSVDIITEAYMKLTNAGITFSEKYPVLFLKNVPEERQYSSNADSSIRFIVIPSSILENNEISRDKKVALIASMIAREATIIDNIKNPENIRRVLGNMVPGDVEINKNNFGFFNEAAAKQSAADATLRLGIKISDLTKQQKPLTADDENELRKILEDSNYTSAKGLANIGINLEPLSVRLGAHVQNAEFHYTGTKTHTESPNEIAQGKAVITLEDNQNTGNSYHIEFDDANNTITKLTVYDKNSNITAVENITDESFDRKEDQAIIAASDKDKTSVQETPKKAILPENIDIVNKMAYEGKGAFAIASAISFKELFASILHPVKYVESHESKTGAITILGATYLSAIATAGLALFVPAIGLAAIPLALAVGLFSNITSHIIIDYHFLKSSGLIDAVREFGSSAKLNEKGYINIPVYVINDQPENYTALNFINSGVKIKGNTLWIGEAENAVVVFSKDASYADISNEMSSNRRLNDRIRKISQQDVKIVLNKDNIAVDWIEVNHNDNSDYIGYSANGNIQASYSMYKQMLDRGEIQDFSASLRRVKNIDASIFAQGILHNLDDISTMEDFIEYLKQHQKIGNGQIVINHEVLSEIIADINNIKGTPNAFALMEFLLDARKTGVQVFVNVNGAQNQNKLQNELEKLGFAGYVSLNTKTGKFELFNYFLRSASDVKTIDDFINAENLENEIKKSSGNVMISNKALRNIIHSERSGMIINQIVEILSSAKILKLFTPADITPEFAMKAARNFSISEVPELSKIASSETAVRELVQRAAEGKITTADLRTMLLESGVPQSNTVLVYLTKLESQVKGKTSEEAAEIFKAFTAGFVEKMLAADKLRKSFKPYGLKDRNYETILGKAMFQQLLQQTESKGVSLSARNLGKTLKEAEEKLAEELNALLPKAFEANDPVAINTLIELIPPIAEQELKMEADDIRPTFNMRNVEKIMAAA